MSFFPEPDPVVLGFLTYRRLIFPLVLALLALVRALSARGPSRLVAAVAFLIAFCAVATQLAPLAGLAQGPVYARAAQALALYGGLTVPLVASGFMLASGFLPGVRWRVIDVLSGLAIAALLGLWWWTS